MKKKELADKDFMEAINLIRGEAGTSVTLRIRRNTDQESSELDFVITRKEIQTPSISEAKIVEDTIGYVRIATFTQSDMISELKEALEELKDDGADRFILDLRNNGGGLVGNALNMAKLFLDETQIITIVQSKKLNIYYYQNQKFPEYEEDIVILQNKYSASATEMFAGAMKSNDRSYIIGETSYGKGSMQGIYSLPNGAALKFTIAKYLGPDGSKVDQVGITPDQEVDSSKLYTIGTKEDKAYQEAITHLKSS